jgi:hypothetical protein
MSAWSKLMSNVRTVLGLPPVSPDTLKRFGPPTYTEEEVLAYAAALSTPPTSERAEVVAITDKMVERARRYLRHGNLEADEAIEIALRSIFDPAAPDSQGGAS